MIARTLTAFALGTLCCAPSMAAEPAFSFIEAAYLKPDEGSRGASLRGSGRLGEQWLVRGNIDVFDRFNGDAGMASLGFGGHWLPHSPIQVSLVVSAEMMGGAFDDDEGGGWDGAGIGAGASLGVHGRAGRKLELQSIATYYELKGDLRDWRLFASATYHLRDNFAVGLDVTDDTAGTRVGLAFRWAFRREP